MQGCPSGIIGQEPVTLSAGLQQLKNEHPPLLRLLSDLLILCERIESADEKAITFQQLVMDVTSFATKLEFHSEREEDYLFRMMEAYLGVGMGPIVVMEYEHEQAKGYIGKFLESTQLHPQQSDEEMVENARLIKEAQYILVNHFAKEENVLYPMAEKLFTDDEKEELENKLCAEKMIIE
jgi:regulator of cell morphogenesis and NO signaling